MPILAKVFQSKQEILYILEHSLPGSAADSYPTSMCRQNKAKDTNALIDRIGFQEAWNRYVTDQMVDDVEAEMAAELARREAA